MDKVEKVKKYVADHKVAITIVATSLIWYKMNRIAMRQHDTFLLDNGLYNEFYRPGE